ncbi:MAG TPA: antitoxin [Mycobacteriales bacterium]|jgi:hypothetical protein|nr:antitoxin [Mycobacteriales bacterium]
MGILEKAKGLLAKNKDKAVQGVEKAAEVAKEKTSGKHDDKISKAEQKAKEGLEEL